MDKDIRDDRVDIVRNASQNDRLDSKSVRREFCNETIGERTNGGVEDEDDQYDQGSRHPESRARLAETADCPCGDQCHKEKPQATEIQCAAPSNILKQSQGHESSKNPETLHPQRDIKTAPLIESHLLVQVRGIPDDRKAAHILRHENHARDLCATQVRPAETRDVRRIAEAASFRFRALSLRTGIFLHSFSMFHHGDGVVQLPLRRRTPQPLQHLFRLLLSPMSHQPPRRFGREAGRDEDDQYPHPLQPKWDTERPRRLHSSEPTQNSKRGELPEQPAEIDVAGQVTSQIQRHHFSGIRRRQGREDAPWKPAQDLPRQERLDIESEKRQEDEDPQKDECAHHGPTIPNDFRHDPVREQANDRPDRRAIAKGCLPFGRDLRLSVLVRHPILMLELIESIEGCDKRRIIAFHDDRKRYDPRPRDRFVIDPQCSPERHPVLRLVGRECGCADCREACS